jgi:multicomponent Na+:H+ antiporter subunit B
VPFIQLFGLYVIVHGHYSPGGGFQGGVLLGASFILLALAFDLKTSFRHFSERINNLLGNAGALIFTGTGVLCALVGGLFLDYSALAALFPMDPIEWRSFGIFIVEVGVGLAVMSIMLSLYWDISSNGDLDEGL